MTSKKKQTTSKKIAQRRNEPNNIRKVRKPLNVNIGMLIFAVILVYVIACVFLSFKTKDIAPYEVKEGSLAANYTYRGLALRDETVVYADRAGYVNYYLREGGRSAKGELVYTVDETGTLNDYLKSTEYEDTALSDSELTDMRSEIVDFAHGFDAENFIEVYEFKYSMKNAVLKLANDILIDNLSSAATQNIRDKFRFNMQLIQES